MSNNQNRLDYKRALSLAERIKSELSPACEKIEIAGSIRRQKDAVGDIELVAIAKHQKSMFEEVPGMSILEEAIKSLVDEERLMIGLKNGEKYKQLHIPHLPTFPIDLFVTSADCWPVIYAIRTGSKDFSAKLVTPRPKGGFLHPGFSVAGGRLWEEGESDPIPLKSEYEFLDYGPGWVEPWER